MTGYDTEEGCIYGMCSNTPEGEEKIEKFQPKMSPMGMIVFEEKTDKISQEEADRNALQYATFLMEDRVWNDDKLASSYGNNYFVADGCEWHTGQRALELWIDWLDDPKHDHSRGYTHANSRNFLIRNRRTAVLYLQQLKNRLPGAADNIDQLITVYKLVIDQAQKMNTANDVVNTTEGREDLKEQIRQIMLLENEAIKSMKQIAQAAHKQG